MSKALVSRRIWYYGDMGAGEGSPAMKDSGPVEVAVPWKVLLLQEVLVLKEVVILRKRRCYGYAGAKMNALWLRKALVQRALVP